MNVFDLFSRVPYRTVVDDVEGGIRYWPDFIDDASARRWFVQLRDSAPWQQQRRPMYERVVDVPRLQAWCSLDGLPIGSPLSAMLVAVQEAVPAPYNTVGLNLYRDGRDSVAMHHDKLHTLVRHQPIALVSLGAPRRMNIREKRGHARAFGLDLMPGSLLVMSHASQFTHEHGIPKTTRTVGQRMSVVFRVRPAE